MPNVTRVYSVMVPAVKPAKAGPHLYARIPATKLTSKKVGTTLNTWNQHKLLVSEDRSNRASKNPRAVWETKSSFCMLPVSCGRGGGAVHRARDTRDPWSWQHQVLHEDSIAYSVTLSQFASFIHLCIHSFIHILE